ncbi:hypothetical protein XEUV181_15305 [Xanthomonas euvesicatoria]|nr:hypothetical protein XEUV181_15305 [Xanthomonas euvesicatoria]KLB33833.1 hypothetical protein XEUV199_14170 [Xanthomonas euvesicatoria]
MQAVAAGAADDQVPDPGCRGGTPLRRTPHPQTRGFRAEDNAPADDREPPSPPLQTRPLLIAP